VREVHPGLVEKLEGVRAEVERVRRENERGEGKGIGRGGGVRSMWDAMIAG